MHEEIHPLLQQDAQVLITPISFRDGIDVARMEIHAAKGVTVQQMAMTTPLDIRRLATMTALAHRSGDHSEAASGLVTVEAIARRIAASLIVLRRHSEQQTDDPHVEMPDPPGMLRLRRFEESVDQEGVAEEMEEELVNISDLILQPLTLVFGPPLASRILLRTAELLEEDDVFATVGRARQTIERLFGIGSAAAFENEVQEEMERLDE